MTVTPEKLYEKQLQQIQGLKQKYVFKYNIVSINASM